MPTLEEWQKAKDDFYSSTTIADMVKVEAYTIECGECHIRGEMTFDQVVNHFNLHILREQKKLWSDRHDLDV